MKSNVINFFEGISKVEDKMLESGKVDSDKLTHIRRCMDFYMRKHLGSAKKVKKAK